MPEHLKTMVLFLAGLSGDPNHRYYVDRLVAGGAALDTSNLAATLVTPMTTRILIEMMNDDAMIIATVYETQNSDMVDIVPTEIASRYLSVMDIHALVWLLENENFHVTSLK